MTKYCCGLGSLVMISYDEDVLYYCDSCGLIIRMNFTIKEVEQEVRRRHDGF